MGEVVSGLRAGILVKPMKTYHSILAAVFLATITIVAFAPTIQNQFNHYDDQFYITDNAMVKSGLNSESVAYAFQSVVVSNWHPLTMLSHMLDCQLFGVDPAAHHAMNLLYHCVNVLLLFFLLKYYTRAFWPSLIVAVIFAVHPLRVESVAWASERKDVLSGMFLLLTLFAYKWYLDRRSVLRYASIAAALALGLMSKPMLVTTPFLLLLLDYWPLNRYEIGLRSCLSNDWRRNVFSLVIEKAPLFLLAAVFSYIAFGTQKHDSSVFELPILVRSMNAFVSYVTYLKMMLIPTHLAVFYPHPFITSRVSVPLFVFAVAAVAVVSVLAVLKAGKARYLFTGWFWYLGLLVPVIGFIQVGDQALADRYTYLPAIGIAIVVAWAACGFLERYTRFRIAGAAIGVILTLGMVLGSRAQTATWKNDFVLFSHAINVTKDNYKMHYDLGIALRGAGDTKAALNQFLQAQKINGRDEMVYMDISSIYMREGRFDEMVVLCNELLSVNPHSWSGYYGRGIARLMKMQQDSAKSDLSAALRLKIDDAQALEQILTLAGQVRDTELANKAGAALIDRYSRDGLPRKAEEVRRKLGESASSSAGAENPPLR